MAFTLLNVLNVAILLFAIFFFASTLASHALEALVGLLNSRGRQLRRRLETALGPEVAREIYRSPVLRSLAADGRGDSRWRAPSYVEPGFFARAVAALVDDPGKAAAREELFRQLKDEAVREGAAFEDKLVEWYKALADRQTGVYTRWSTFRLFLIGLALAAAVDIDVVHIGAALWRQPAVAEDLAARLERAAPALAAGASPAALPDDQRAGLVAAVGDAWPELRAAAAGAEGPPAYGWQKPPSGLTSQEWGGKLLGWLLTALATSLGAQFWFRLLSESLKLRAAGRKPEASLDPAPAEEAPPPPAPAAAPRPTALAAGFLPISATAAPPPADEPLGILSSRYEVGDRGPGTVSSGAGDAGGASYGSYQMTSRPGGGTVAAFVADPAFPWRHRFVGLTPGSEGFTARWKALAAEAPAEFFRAQHAFVKRTHHDPLVARTAEEDRLDVRLRSNALQNVVWSTAVQHGPKTAVLRNAIAAAPRGPEAADADLIRAVYAERGRRGPDGALAYFRRNSEAVQAGVARRFVGEQRDALRMLADETPARVEEA